METDYTQRIEALLTPLVGPGRVRAQVVADLDCGVSEEAHEQYKPDSQIVRSEQTVRGEQPAARRSGGVPGRAHQSAAAPGVRYRSPPVERQAGQNGAAAGTPARHRARRAPMQRTPAAGHSRDASGQPRLEPSAAVGDAG